MNEQEARALVTQLDKMRATLSAAMVAIDLLLADDTRLRTALREIVLSDRGVGSDGFGCVECEDMQDTAKAALAEEPKGESA
jgi:hypothetical protein